MRQISLVVLVVATALAAPMMTLAQIEMQRWVVGCGCGDVSGTGHAVSSTVGQAAIGELSGPSFIHEIGFWYPLPGQPMGADDGEPLRPPRFALHLAGVATGGRGALVHYALPVPCSVSLRLYDLTGRQLRILARGLHPAGTHEVRLVPGGLPSGVYFCRLIAGGFTQTRRVALLR